MQESLAYSRRELFVKTAAAGALFLEDELVEQEGRVVYFPETGHNLGGEFLNFYRIVANGKLLGLPISEVVFDKEGRRVQYFQNARLEEHPEFSGTPWYIQIGLLGEELIPRWLREDSSWVLDKEFFEKHGGVDFFGPAISEPFVKEGKRLQYTQRFLLVEQEVEAPPTLTMSYKIYKKQKEFFPTLLWPGHIDVLPLGVWATKKYGVKTTKVEPSAGSVVNNDNLWDSQKLIKVSISSQKLTAYEGQVEVFSSKTSTGRPGFDTPQGRFSVLSKIGKMPYRSPFPERIRYYYEEVPFNLLFYRDYLIHGKYWNEIFGTRSSSGCVNLNIDDAAWIYSWARVGTPVFINE